MTAAKTTNTKPKTSPSKAARKTAPADKPKPKAQPSKAKADDEPITDAEAMELAADCAERAADAQVRELTTTTPLYMRTLLDQAPAWYANDSSDVVDDRADKLTSELLLLGGNQ